MICVDVLHDRPCVSTLVAHDPPVAGWVRDVRGQQRDRRLAVRLLADQRLEQLRGDQRRVADGHQHLADARRNPIEPDPDRVRGAQLGFLADARRTRQEGLDLFSSVPHHHDPVLDPGSPHRVEYVAEDRPAGERVEDLGQAGTHPRPLASGQDDGRGG